MNWKMVIDEKTFKITTDEPTDDKCWDFWQSSSESSGYGSISTTRELCIKKILRSYKKELEEKEKELYRLRKNYRKLEESVIDE